MQVSSLQCRSAPMPTILCKKRKHNNEKIDTSLLNLLVEAIQYRELYPAKEIVVDKDYSEEVEKPLKKRRLSNPDLLSLKVFKKILIHFQETKIELCNLKLREASKTLRISSRALSFAFNNCLNIKWIYVNYASMKSFFEKNQANVFIRTLFLNHMAIDELIKRMRQKGYLILLKNIIQFLIIDQQEGFLQHEHSSIESRIKKKWKEILDIPDLDLLQNQDFCLEGTFSIESLNKKQIKLLTNLHSLTKRKETFLCKSLKRGNPPFLNVSAEKLQQTWKEAMKCNWLGEDLEKLNKFLQHHSNNIFCTSIFDNATIDSINKLKVEINLFYNEQLAQLVSQTK